MNFQLVSLSIGPNYFGVYLFLTIIFVFLILTAIVVALRHKKHKKFVAIAAVALLAVTASASIVWSNAASMEYWLLSDYAYSAVADNVVTIYCENTGSTPGTFNLKIEFTNAEFSTKTSQLYKQLNSQSAKFTLTINPGEKRAIPVHFTIDNNVQDFYITLTTQTSELSFVRYNANGVNQVSYQIDADSGNYTQRTAAPPP